MSRFVRPVVQPILGAASLAADVGGVPGLGVATDLLDGIRQHCEKVVSHKVRSMRVIV